MKQIVLLTDFGLTDQYAGIIKGVIRKISPEISITDLTHSIQPQNIKQAAFILRNSYKYFRYETIFLSVVDPGVGSERRAIAMQTENYFFVAPDNGLLSFIIENEKIVNLIELTNENYHLKDKSNTFHGRDIFAPVSAHLGNGTDIIQIGKKINPEKIIKLKPLKLEISNDCITGEIIYSDNFGNLITSIPSNIINYDYANIKISIGNKVINKISKTYSDVKPGMLIAYIGSSGYLEIGLNLSSLADKINYKIGDICDIILNLKLK
jgi:hypothetical protein